jgi:hypothetical protein
LIPLHHFNLEGMVPTTFFTRTADSNAHQSHVLRKSWNGEERKHRNKEHTLVPM